MRRLGGAGLVIIAALFCAASAFAQSGVTTWQSAQPGAVSPVCAAGQLVGGTGAVNACATLTGDLASTQFGVFTVNHFSLTSAANANSNRVTNLAAPAAAGDALSEGGAAGLVSPLTALKATGALNLQGTSGNGTDAVNSVNLNGVVNPATYGVMSGGSTTTETASISSSSSALTLGAAGDFANRQGIYIPHAGANDSETAPSTTPTITNVGTAGSTSYSYCYAYLDGLGGETACSTAGSTSTGNATLSSTNYNSAAIAFDTTASSAAIYRTAGGSCQGLIGFVVSSTGAGFTPFFNDTGQSCITGLPSVYSTASSYPAASLADALDTTISSGGGTASLTLAASAGNTVSSVSAYHDDAVIINAARAATWASAPTTLKLYPGTYTQSSPITMGQADHATTGGGGLVGYGTQTTLIEPDAAMVGLSSVKLINMNSARIADLTIQPPTVSTEPLMCGIESNVNEPTAGNEVGENHIDNVFIGQPPGGGTGTYEYWGICFTAAPGYDENNSEQLISNVSIISGGGINAGIGILHSNSLQNRVIGSDVNGKQAAIMTDGGSFDAIGDVLTANSGGYLFWLGPGSQLHDDLASGAKSESVADLLYVASGATGADFRMSNSHLKIGTNSTNMIDWEDQGGNDEMSISNSHFGEGIAGAAYRFNGLNGNVQMRISHSRIGVGTISYNTGVSLWGDTMTSGMPTFTNLGNGVLQGVLLTDLGDDTLFEVGHNYKTSDLLSDYYIKGVSGNTGMNLSPAGPCGGSISMTEGNTTVSTLGGCAGNTWDVSTSLEAAVMKNDCAGQATLSSGAATVTNACIVTGRPIICTDNTDTTAVPCTAIPSAGSLAIHGTGTDTVSWAQF